MITLRLSSACWKSYPLEKTQHANPSRANSIVASNYAEDAQTPDDCSLAQRNEKRACIPGPHSELAAETLKRGLLSYKPGSKLSQTWHRRPRNAEWTICKKRGSKLSLIVLLQQAPKKKSSLWELYSEALCHRSGYARKTCHADSCMDPRGTWKRGTTRIRSGDQLKEILASARSCHSDCDVRTFPFYFILDFDVYQIATNEKKEPTAPGNNMIVQFGHGYVLIRQCR